MDIPLIEFRNITKRFGEKTVLDKVNVKIYENQITTIIGKSGTGKSVFLKHIIGLLKPDDGDILFQGRSVLAMTKNEREEYRSRIAYLFQNNALLDSMTVFENVAFPLRQTTRMNNKDIEEKVWKRITDLELIEAVGSYPAELSGGMQKRVALARALVTDPKIVLFDEPTTGQDPVRKNMILSMIVHYRRKFGFTAVLISHDIPDVFFISDRIVVLWEGTVGFQGTYKEIGMTKLPLVDEFIRSLEGFQDELTGLLSREAFRVHYAAMPGGTAINSAVSAVLFSIRLNLLRDALGAQASVEVLRSLGEYTSRRFMSLGGFSARHSRDEILTILPHTSAVEAKELVAEFGRELCGENLATIQSTAGDNIGTSTCFEIFVHAGITEVSPNDEIEKIIERARKNQEIVAAHRCESEGSAQ